jgi:tetrahydromethanopterin S-methyltransferase subunit C
MVSIEISGLLFIILGIFVAATAVSTWGVAGVVDGISLIVFGLIVWIVFFVKFIKTAMREAHSTVGTGLIKTIE